MSNKNKVRIGMIGAGRHASAQLYPLLHRLDGAEVVAACDLDPALARAAASRHGIPVVHADWRTMLAESRPDACIVCVGDRVHAELAVELLHAGVHVLVEKPHAPSLAASQRMLAAARSSGRICMAAYKKRFAPAYLAARTAIRDPAFGAPCHLSCQRSMGGSNQTDPAYLWQWGCHVTDLVYWLLGAVTEVHAWRSAGDWRAVSINLRFASGAVGNLALLSPGGNWERLTVTGRSGRAVRVDDGWSCLVHDGNAPLGGCVPSAAASLDSGTITGFLGELQAFVTAVRDGSEPDAGIASICHTIAIHEAAMRSLAEDRPVPVAANATIITA